MLGNHFLQSNDCSCKNFCKFCNKLKMLFYWTLMHSVIYFAQRLRIWPASPEGRAAENMHSDCKWKWMTSECPGVGWDRGLSLGPRHAWSTFFVLPTCPLLSSSSYPSQWVGARAGKGGTSRGKGWNRSVCTSLLAIWERREALPCICSGGGMLSGTPTQRGMPLHTKMPESTSDMVPECCGCPRSQQQFVCSPGIDLLSWEQDWVLAGQQSRKINRKLGELIMWCETIPYLVTRRNVAQSIKQP